MPRQNDNFGKKLVGLNREQVDSYLKEINHSHMAKIEELKSKLNSCHEEREKLSEELIRKEEEAKAYVKSQKFLELAQKRVEGTINFMTIAASNESKDIEELYEKKVEEYNNEIMELERQIDNKQEQLNFLKQRLVKSISTRVQPAVHSDKSSKKENKAMNGYNGAKSKQGKFWDDSEDEEDDVKGNYPHKELNQKVEDDFVEIQKESYSSKPVAFEDMNIIRNKYLIGKVAGEDVLDRNGNVLISKNGLITAEVVERVEQEGKLAELIVNMLLPGMEN